MGGLLAGVSLASTPCRETIAARLAPLSDFLPLFFLIAPGATLDPSLPGAHVTGAIVFYPVLPVRPAGDPALGRLLRWRA